MESQCGTGAESGATDVVHRDVACTLCGCVCDDLAVTVRDNRIVRAERACALAEPWYFAQNRAVAADCAVNGEPVRLDDALAAAGEILARARSPLVYGLSRSNTDGQRAAVALAERLGATIDTTASLCHAPSILGLQMVGESTCSLGEIRNRADLVVFWGCDPLVSHPRHMERYSVDPPGLFIPNGRRDRFVVVVDSERTASADRADVFLRVEPERDFDVLWALRAMVLGKPLPNAVSVGAPLTELRRLADKMTGCRCGVVFFGLGLSRRGLGHLNVAALLSLVRDLHRHTRFHARRMRVQGDVTGADSVLCWQTGFPYAVNFARGYPRHNPGEFTAQ